MSYSDWNVYGNGLFTGCTLTSYDTDAYGNPLPPIISTTYPGTGLYPPGAPNRVAMGHVTFGTGILGTVGMVPKDSVFGTKGAMAGTITANTQQISVLRNDVPTGTGPMNWGITCLQNQEDITAAGACYALMMDTVNGARIVRLIKMTSGISYSPGGAFASSYIVLAETHSPSFPLALDGNYTVLSLAWLCDPYYLNGTRLIARYGQGAASILLCDIVHTGRDAIQEALGYFTPGIYVGGQTNTAVVTFTNIVITRQDITTVNGQPYPLG